MEQIYGLGEIPEFELEILASGEHKVFLPQGFCFCDGRLTVRADLSGMRSLESSDVNTPMKLLDFFEKLSQNLVRAENYMFDVEQLGLDVTAMYFDEYGNLFFQYIKDAERGPVCERIDRLAMQIKESLFANAANIDYDCAIEENSQEGEIDDSEEVARNFINFRAAGEYLEMFRALLLQNPKPEKLVNLAGKLKREAYYCGYN